MLARLTTAAVLFAIAAPLIPAVMAQPNVVQPSQGLSPAYRSCLERAHHNTVQLGMCEQTEMAAQDARLNKAYQQVMRQLAREPDKQMALRTQQRSWLKERDYTCKVDPRTLDDSCLVGKTATRANELERMIRF